MACHSAMTCFQSSRLFLSLERSVPASCHTFYSSAEMGCMLCDCRAEAVDCTAVGPLLRGDVPLSAVDFHCSTITDDLQQVRLRSASTNFTACACCHHHRSEQFWVFNKTQNDVDRRVLRTCSLGTASYSHRTYSYVSTPTSRDWGCGRCCRSLPS